MQRRQLNKSRAGNDERRDPDKSVVEGKTRQLPELFSAPHLGRWR